MVVIKCDFCKKDAEYDGKTVHGPWAYMCQKCFDKYGLKIDGLYNELIEDDSPDFNDSISIYSYKNKEIRSDKNGSI